MSTVPRQLAQSVTTRIRSSSRPWPCFKCNAGLRRQTPPTASTSCHLFIRRRLLATEATERQKKQRDETAARWARQMDQFDGGKNKTKLYYVLSLALATVAFSYGSVPMYKMICQQTGWGGQPVRASSDISDRVTPVTTAPRIRVTFASSVSDLLPWKFVPQQREVRVLPGETALAFYTATNNSDRDVIGVATYSVSPPQCAPYFSKIQCFCFEEQRLAAGESVDMPVFFYLDPDLLKDLNMKGVETVTLNYTFFSEF